MVRDYCKEEIRDWSIIYRHYLQEKRAANEISNATPCRRNQPNYDPTHSLSPVVPPPPTIIVHNRHPSPLIHIAPSTPTPLPPIAHMDPRPTPLPSAIPLPTPKAALALRRLHVPVVFILRPTLWTIRSLAPDLALPVHILAAVGARGPGAVARARADLDILRRAVVTMAAADVAGRRRGSRDVDRCGRRLDEHGHRLRRRDGEGFGLWSGHRDVGC